MQYEAAMIGSGTEAKTAPNLPEKISIQITNKFHFRELGIEKFELNLKVIPNREKKIMKADDIWITLRLPTRVSANKPAFSLPGEINQRDQLKRLHIMNLNKAVSGNFTYTEAAGPVTQPHKAANKVPIPWTQKAQSE